MSNENRSRNVRLNFYVNENEKSIIDDGILQSGANTLSQYLRLVATNTTITTVDMQPIVDLSYQLGKIGTNVNQIAKRINMTGNARTTELEYLKEELALIKCELQNLIKKFDVYFKAKY